MHTLLLTNEYPPYVFSGPGVHVEYLSKALAKHISLDIRTFHDQDETSGNVTVTGFNAFSHVFSGCSSSVGSALRSLATCLDFVGQKPISADLVHCHTWDTYVAGFLAKKFYGLPLVITMHSMEALRPWRKQHIGTPYDFAVALEGMILRQADAIIANSSSTKEDMLKVEPRLNPDKIHIIYNGIDVNAYAHRPDPEFLKKTGVDPAKPYVLFIGPLARQKGLKYTLEAMKHIADPDVQLVICGGASSSNADMREELVLQIKALQATRKGVIFIDELMTREQTVALYSGAAVFCCSSIYEPFGLINLEAMACEVPVVATAIGGIREVVSSSDVGILVEPDLSPTPPFEPHDPAGFAKKLAASLTRLLGDPELCARMKEKGRAHVIERFSWDRIADQTIRLYDRILQTAGTAGGDQLENSPTASSSR